MDDRKTIRRLITIETRLECNQMKQSAFELDVVDENKRAIDELDQTKNNYNNLRMKFEQELNQHVQAEPLMLEVLGKLGSKWFQNKAIKAKIIKNNKMNQQSSLNN